MPRPFLRLGYLTTVCQSFFAACACAFSTVLNQRSNHLHSANAVDVSLPVLPLPWQLLDIEEDTAVVGDVDAFIDYIESGEALQDWCDIIMQTRRELGFSWSPPTRDRVGDVAFYVGPSL